MADEKITALTELTDALTSDILYAVDDPAGTPARRKITLVNLVSAVSGEIFLSTGGGWPSTTNGPSDHVKNEYVTNDIDVYSMDFDQTTEEFAQWTVWMLDNLDAENMPYEVTWTTTVSTGSVLWAIEAVSYANGDPIDSAPGSGWTTFLDAALTAGDIHYASSVSGITIGGSPAAGEMVQFRVYRNQQPGDDMAADALLLGVKLYYGIT